MYFKFTDPQTEFADPQPEFRESIFLSSQSKDFHWIWNGTLEAYDFTTFNFSHHQTKPGWSRGLKTSRTNALTGIADNIPCHLQPNTQTPLLDLYSLFCPKYLVCYHFIHFYMMDGQMCVIFKEIKTTYHETFVFALNQFVKQRIIIKTNNWHLHD